MRPRTLLLAWLCALACAVPAQAAAEGKIAVAGSHGGVDSIRVIDPDGTLISTTVSRAHQNPRTSFRYAAPSWSPDATKLAYSNPQLNIMGGVWLAPGGALTPADTTMLPAWSPKGDEIAYWHHTGQAIVLRAIHPDGSGGRTIAGTVHLSHAAGPPAWSPDGKKIAYIRPDELGTGGTLFELPAAGGTSRIIASPGLDGSLIETPAYSPDGKSIAFKRKRYAAQPAYQRLVVRDLATGKEQLVTEVTNRTGSGEGIAWSPDSKRLAYVEGAPSCGSGGCNLVTIKADGTDKRTILHADEYLRDPAWSRPPLPNYYVKHIEVAQAIAPDLPPLGPGAPESEGPIGFDWLAPSVGGSAIPLVAERSTLVRVYVGDANLPAGGSEERYVRYRITGSTLTQPVERLDNVAVTAPDVEPSQTRPAAALNVWLPASVARTVSRVRLDVELNPDEEKPECVGCYPKGNKAFLDGMLFEEGGNVIISPVRIYVFAPDGKVTGPKNGFDQVWPGMTPMLPIGESGLRSLEWEHPLAVNFGDLLPGRLDHVNPGTPEVDQAFPCAVLLSRLEELRLMSPPATLAPGSQHWVGLTSHPLAEASCGGTAYMPGRSMLLTARSATTALHELGHNLGLPHTLGYNSVPGAEPVALPYIGIGGAGYNNFGGYLEIFDKSVYGDIMSYSPSKWTSPFSWLRTFEEILARSGGVASATASGRRQSTARASAGATRNRRVVTGFIVDGHGVILRSLVASAARPMSSGEVVGRLVARDRRGRRVATAKIRANAAVAAEEGLPFAVALPASKRIASLALLPPSGTKPLNRLTASKHAPRARFVKVPRRAAASRKLTVRWRATDQDRDPLSVVLLAKRGGGVWRTVAMGPARFKTHVDPRTFGSGKRLRLRLVAGDGFNTTTATARPVALKR
jgi:Tol biopolymer transport system component